MMPAWQIEKNRKLRERRADCHARWATAAAMRASGMKVEEVGNALGVCKSRISQMVRLHERHTSAFASAERETP